MSQEKKTKFDEFMELPLVELKKILASGVFDRHIVFEDKFVVSALELAIEEKERVERKELGDKNLRSTKQLVFATWGLVIVTALLVLVTFIKK